jgi:hypothetical protein
MTRLMISALATIALVTAATTALRSHSIWSLRSAATTGMPAIEDLPASADTSKLPVQEFEDRSLVYPNQPSR